MNEKPKNEDNEGASTKNISLERPAMVEEHNELGAKWDNLTDEQRDDAWKKKGDPEILVMRERMNELFDSVKKIDRYREEAGPEELQELDEEDSLSQKGEEKQDILESEKINKKMDEITKEISYSSEDLNNNIIILNKLQVELGIEPTENVPSVNQAKERIELLKKQKLELKEQLIQVSPEEELNRSQNQNKEELPSGSNEEREELDERLAKKGLEQLVSSGAKIINILKTRESQNLNSLIRSEELSKLRGGFMGLESVKISDSEELESHLSKINSAIDSIGDSISRGRQVREDTESLGRLSHALKVTDDPIIVFSKGLLALDKEKYSSALKHLNRLKDLFLEKWILVKKKHQALSGF